MYLVRCCGKSTLMEIAINIEIVAARCLVLKADSLRENEFPLSGGRYIDLYSIIRYPFGYFFVIVLKRVPERVLRVLLEVVNKLNPFRRFQRKNHYFPDKR